MGRTLQLLFIMFLIELGLYRTISKIFIKYEEKLFKEPNGVINLDRMHRWTMFIILWLNIAVIVAGGVYFVFHAYDPLPRIPFISDMNDEARFREDLRGYEDERLILIGQRMNNPEYFWENEQIKLQNIEKKLVELRKEEGKYPHTKNTWMRSIILIIVCTAIFYYLTI